MALDKIIYLALSIIAALTAWVTFIRSRPWLKIVEFTCKKSKEMEGIVVEALVVNKGNHDAEKCCATWLAFGGKEDRDDGNDTEWSEIEIPQVKYPYCFSLLTKHNRARVETIFKFNTIRIVSGDPSRHFVFPTESLCKSFLLILIITYGDSRKVCRHSKIHISRKIKEETTASAALDSIEVKLGRSWMSRFVVRRIVSRYFSELKRYDRKPGELPVEGK